MKKVTKINGLIKILVVFLFIYQIGGWCLRTKIRQGESKPIKAVDFSKASQDFIAIAREDGINIYNQTTFQLLGGIPDEGDRIQSIAFSKVNGGLFAVGYNDQDDLRIYDTTSFPFGAKNYNALGISRRGLGLDFNDAGNRLLVCGDSSNARQITNMNTGSPSNSNPGNSGSSPARDCQYSPSGLIGVAYNNKISGVGAGFTVTFSKTCNSIDFCPDNSYAIAGCTDSKGYQIRNGVQVGSSFYSDTASIDAAAFAPDGSIFFMGGASKIVALFYPNRTLMAKFPVDSAIISGRFDMTSSKLLVGTTGGYAYLFRKDCQFKCQPNFYMDIGSICSLCYDILPFCSQCTSANNCTSCMTGYVLTGGSCIKCSQFGCLQCTSDNVDCLVCNTGFLLNATTKKCERCIGYLTYCLICATSTNCTKCDSIAYLDATTNKCVLCQTMINRCLTCSDQNKCVSCQIGYYVTSTFTCNKCPSNCIACNKTTQCQQCANGYYISAASGPYTGNNNCLRCPTAGCYNCNNTGTCIQCVEGKYLEPTAKTCIQCVYPCSVCNSTTNCFACINGFYLSGTATCVACDTGCQTCNQTGKCLTCWESYTLDPTTKLCVRCSKLYGNCSICTSTACLMCTEGFFYDSATTSCLNCLKTIKNCMICKDATNCYECSLGYYETLSTGNLSCAPCSLGCAKCISGTNCQSCLSQFYYSTGQCLNCVVPCVTCLDAATCLSCGNGYYLDSATKTCKICYSGIPNCLTCYNTSYCVGCKHGYYLNTLKTACVKCPSNCTTCESDTYCHSCEIGYYLDSTSKNCTQCKQTCATCSSQTVCQKCISGYFLDTDFTCKKCPLSNCIQCLSTTECTQCSDGTFIDSVATSPTYKTCIYCNDIVPNCMLCNDIEQCTLCKYGFGLSTNRLSCLSCATAMMGCVHCQKLSSCLMCQPQFYITDLNSDGLFQCGTCGKGCRTCTTSTLCQSCFQGYYLDATGKCLTCPQSITGCQVCDNSTGAVQCSKCRKQYYNSSSTVCSLCSQSINGFLYCNDSTHCSLCQSGSYLEVSSQKCKPCSDILNGCELCSSDSICLECQNGYFLDSTSKKCKKCTTTIFGCLSCSNDTHCSLCEHQTYLSLTTHKCVSCAKDLFGCISCTSSLQCIQCDSGFYLNSGNSKCQVCQQKGCEICYESDPLKCVACNSLYVMDNTAKTCLLCNSLVGGCIQCQNTTGTVQCSQCMIGYYQDLAGQCKLCSSQNKGCVRCSDQNHCIECESLYYLSSNATHAFCSLCSTPISHCDICNTSTSCIECSSSFFLSTDAKSCKFCSEYIQNCIYCQDQSTCILCDTEYFIQAGKCEKCSSKLSGCYSCVDSTHCTACINGYTFDPNTTTCKTLSLSAPQPAVKTLKLKSYFESKQKLRHVLFSQGMKFNKSTTQISALMKQITISMKDKALITYNLVINSWQLSRDQYSIVFFTNNPIDFNLILQKNSSKYKMQFRLLQTTNQLTDLNIDTDLKIPKDLAKALLPELDYNSEVGVNYNLNGPQFYASLVQNSQFFESKYYIIGYIILIVLLINFLIKFFFTGKNSLNYGQIIPHIVAIKTVGVAVYPGHYEMISFCKGFMIYDVPWANAFFGSVFGSTFDYIPEGYRIFYANMNIGSTYFIALLLVVILIIVDRVFLRKKAQQSKKQKQQNEQDQERSQLEDNKQKFSKWLNPENGNKQPSKIQILYTSIFGFSLVQASLCSLIGAIYSEFPDIGINFIMHLIGSCIYFVLLLHTIYVSYINFPMYSNNLRLFIKATVLSLSYLAPVYLVVVAFLIDSALLVVEYQYSAYGLNNYTKDKTFIVKKLFYISQFLANITLLFVYFINSHLIAFVIAVLLITICVFIQFFLHCKEYSMPYQAPSKLRQNNHSNAMLNQSEQFNQSNAFNPMKVRSKFNSTNYSNDQSTVVSKKTFRNTKNPHAFAKSHDLHRRDKNTGFFNDI